MTQPPTSATALRRAIDDAAAHRSVAPGRLHYTVASTVVLQMAPYGMAKGGGAIRQRVDEHNARLTRDLDYSLDEDTDIAEIFIEVGLPAPEPVLVMSAEHQITQKVHACTGLDAASRAHDLVDIQILAAVEDLDYPAIAAIGPRLFAYRQRHEWPPTVIAHDGWDGLYSSACEEIVNDKVLPAVADAVELVNSIIERAVGSTG